MSRVRAPWTPGLTDTGGNAQTGVALVPNVAGVSANGVWWFQRSGGPANVRAGLWRASDQANLADTGTVSTAGFTAETWNLIPFGAPVALTSGAEYAATVLVPSVASIGYDPDDLTGAVTSGDGAVTFPAGGGRFISGNVYGYPASTWSGMHAVDVDYSVAGGPTLTVSKAVQVQAAQAPTLTRIHVLDPAKAVQVQAAANVVLTVPGVPTLTVSKAVQAQTTGPVALTQLHVLTVSKAVQLQAAQHIVWPAAARRVTPSQAAARIAGRLARGRAPGHER